MSKITELERKAGAFIYRARASLAQRKALKAEIKALDSLIEENKLSVIQRAKLALMEAK